MVGLAHIDGTDPAQAILAWLARVQERQHSDERRDLAEVIVVEHEDGRASVIPPFGIHEGERLTVEEAYDVWGVKTRLPAANP